VDAQGRWLVTVAHDKTGRVWDLATGRLLRVLRIPLAADADGKLFATAISPDGRLVALGGWLRLSGDTSKAHNILIYDRASGRLLRRLTGLDNVTHGLAFSPDGQWLAAGVAGGDGLRVWHVSDWSQSYRDRDFNGGIYGMDFSRDGRLATFGEDGFVRLYRLSGGSWSRERKTTVPGGKDPLSIQFSPDDRYLALGFYDTPRVNVLDGETLELAYEPDTDGIKDDNIGWVGWSADGERLYAGGRYSRNSQHMARVWQDGGRGSHRDLALARDTLSGLHPLPDGRMVYLASDPVWGWISPDGQVRPAAGSPIGDLRGSREGFRVSADGLRVRFGFESDGRSPVVFDLVQQAYVKDEAGLIVPRHSAPGMEPSNWKNYKNPSLNGQSLKLSNFETSRSVVAAADGIILGADWNLRRFDRNGKELWSRPTPGTNWGLNRPGDGEVFVAANGDGALRWHRVSDGAELLAFYPHADRKRWVLWTPGGYFAASPGGEELIGWHLNRGLDQEPDFFPASRFRERFHRPDVIARILQTRDEGEALRLANLESGRRQNTQRVQDVLPPVVEVLAPQDGASVSSEKLALRYRVRTPGDAPVTSLRVRVNGQPVQTARSLGVVEDEASEAVREVQVPIPKADSEIQVFAENRNGVSVPALVRVKWAGAREEFIIKPKLYVLAIGVSDYSNPSYRLHLAAKDARDFAQAMTQQKGRLYRDVEVKLLTDREAHRDDILDGLDWLRRQVTAKDVGMLFLAGHGTHDPDGIYYYLPVNADADRLRRTSVVFSEIRNTLSNLAGKSVFFVDTCHSGDVLGGGRRAVSDISGVINELASAENGVVVFSSSTGRQFSLEDPKWGNGAFTKALVEGLTGRADIHGSGRITHKSLDFYISERVKELTGGRQTPVTQAPGGVPDFPIAVR
jgi:WD40 repeat protein